MLLTDGYIANGSEPWLIPNFENLPKIICYHPTLKNDETGYMPYKRDKDLVRPWAIPGTPGLEHRVGGIEKQDVTGNVSYDPANHEHMVQTRAKKVAGIKPQGDAYVMTGPEKGDLLLLSWGSTYGAVKAATLVLQQEGEAVSHLHLRYLNPLPDLGPILKNFRQVIVPEMNLGQLLMMIRAKYLVDAKGLNKVRGQPFTIVEVANAVRAALAGEEATVGAVTESDDVGGGG
jgi:2-oxoglutarate ferredoxin oxidoreductase subunit alpha